MPDLQPWWKLWCSALDDPSLEALSLEGWARWARLALLVKRHGDGGRAVFEHPWRPLSRVLRTRAVEHCIMSILRSLPGVLAEMPETPKGTITVTFKNWRKYQESPSAQRTRAWRDTLARSP